MGPATTDRRGRLSVVLALGLLSLALGCSEDRISVSFDIPERYQDLVVSQSLSVYVVPPAEAYDCDQVAFAELSPEELAPNLITSDRAAEGALLSIDEVPRDGDKLFVFEGRSEGGLLIVAGCTVVRGLVPDSSTVMAEPALVVTSPDDGLGSGLREELEVRVADVTNEAQAGLELRWSLVATGDQFESGQSMTNSSGIATIAAPAPALGGPIALDFRVRWEQSTNPSLRAFQSLPRIDVCNDACPLPANGGAIVRDERDRNTIVTGRVGPNGEPGFAAMGPSSPLSSERQILIVYHDASRNPPIREVESTTTVSGATSLGLVTKSGRDVPFTIADSEWIEMNAATGTLASFPFATSPALGIVSLASCDSGENELVLLQTGDSRIEAFDANRQPVNSPFANESLFESIVPPGNTGLGPIAGGCVADLAGQEHLSVAYRSDSGLVVAAAMDSFRVGRVPALANGVAFAPGLGSEPGTLVATEFAIAGADLFRYRLSAVGSNGVEADPIEFDPTPSILENVTSGDYDGDGERDYIGTTLLGGSRVFASVAVEHNGGRLVGISGELNDGQRLRPITADMNGDGIDDLIVVSNTDYAIFTTMR